MLSAQLSGFPPCVFVFCVRVTFQVSTKEALEGKHVAFYFSSQAVEDQLEKAAQGQEAVRPTPVVKEVSFPFLCCGRCALSSCFL